MATVWLGLGTNLGDREANLAAALAGLGEFTTITAISSIYRSEPVGYRDQPDFLNLVIRAEAPLPAAALLTEIKAIEGRLGRRPAFRNAPRPIDIDILLYENQMIVEPDLVIPHPRMTERAFVLLPLLEIDPDLVHPQTGAPLRDYLKLREFEEVERLGPADHLLPDR